MFRDRRRAPIVLCALAWPFLVSACEALERRAAEAPEPMRRLEDLIEIDESRVVAGQTLYVPAYSQIPLDERHRMPLAVSLSVRNTDDQHPIAITSVRYYASSGELLRELIGEGAVRLDPMATATHAIGAMDRAGGEGANFVLEWVAAHRVSPPIVESVMVSTGTQGISFVSRGEVIRER
ncbi:MAG: DUF3124 domain-containing protein [Myxococcota bacterium]|nr:DUF3124 domain-containing protein [Myxococcota bacterium]